MFLINKTWFYLIFNSEVRPVALHAMFVYIPDRFRGNIDSQKDIPLESIMTHLEIK